MSETFIRVDDNGRYQPYEMVDGRIRRDLPMEPFESPRQAHIFADIHDGRLDILAWLDAQDPERLASLPEVES